MRHRHRNSLRSIPTSHQRMSVLALLVVLVIIVIVWLLAVLLFPARPARVAHVITVSPSSVMAHAGGAALPLPAGYYGWMITDASLAHEPVLPFPLPCPTLHVQATDRVQLVQGWDLGTRRPYGPIYSCTVGELVHEYLLGAVQEHAEFPDAPPAPEASRSYRAARLQGLRVGDGRLVQPADSTAHLYRVTLITADQECWEFDVAFQLLPATPTPERPRPAVRHLGYFTTPLTEDGRTADYIQRYYQSPVRWYLTAEVPAAWRPAITRAFAYWQRLLAGSDVQLQLAPEPWTGAAAAPTVNLLTIARTRSYSGIGTTVVDARNGAAQWSRIALSLPLERLDLFDDPVHTVDERQARFLEYVVRHELGHTLGARHNFANICTSTMSYSPKWVPDREGVLHFLPSFIGERGDPARDESSYDRQLIEYGYHGRTTSHPMIDDSPATPAIAHFHTDENIEERILTACHRSYVAAPPLTHADNWLRAWARLRPTLFREDDEITRDVERTLYCLTSMTDAVALAAAQLGTVTTNYGRTRLTATVDNDTVIARTLALMEDYLTGTHWQLTREEPFLLGGDAPVARPLAGRYTVEPLSTAELHTSACQRVLRAACEPARLARLPNVAAFMTALVAMSTRHATAAHRRTATALLHVLEERVLTRPDDASPVVDSERAITLHDAARDAVSALEQYLGPTARRPGGVTGGVSGGGLRGVEGCIGGEHGDATGADHESGCGVTTRVHRRIRPFRRTER